MRLSVLPIVVAGFAVACASAPPPPAAPATKPSPPPPALPDRAWGVVDSARFFVTIPLPDRDQWRVDDASGRWLVATHLASKSIVLARSWHEGSVVSAADCENIARPWRRDVFGKDASALVDRRPITAPEGYVGEVGFSVHRAGDALGGVAVLVAAKVRRCLVLAYVTKAEGEDAPTKIADRLALVTARVFGETRERSVEDRVEAPVR